MSYARLELSDFGGADLTWADLHGTLSDGANWRGATLKKTRQSNLERLDGETWRPPQPRPDQGTQPGQIEPGETS